MTRRNRKTLKNYFSKGRLPSEENFADLIDSVVNIVDEGISKTFEDGLKISTIGDSNKLISIYKDIEDKKPVWQFELDQSKNTLTLLNDDNQSILVITKDGKIALNKEKPEYDLDIDGVISATGFVGNYKKGTVPADGNWHTVLANLDGCHAFEIMAGVGKKGSGKYSLIRATVISTFNGKNSISQQGGFFGSLCNKIRIKIIGKQNSYDILMKTRCNYGENINISYNLSRLWFDPFMKDSQDDKD